MATSNNCWQLLQGRVQHIEHTEHIELFCSSTTVLRFTVKGLHWVCRRHIITPSLTSVLEQWANQSAWTKQIFICNQYN